MFVQAVSTEDEKLMKLALLDKLHQPYRAKLIPWLADINQAIKHDDDIFGCVLSGAGSSVLIISKQSAIENVKSKVAEVMANLNIKYEIKNLKIENNGAVIL